MIIMISSGEGTISVTLSYQMLISNISDEYRMATADDERDDRLGKGQFQ